MRASRLCGLVSGLAAFVLSALSLPGPARGDEKLEFVLVRVEEPQPVENADIKRGSIVVTYPDARLAFSWDEPPERFGAEGFSLMLRAEGHIDAASDKSTPGLATSLYAFEGVVADPEWADADLPAMNPGDSFTDEQPVTVKPLGPLAPGQTAEIGIGSSNGMRFTYHYAVGGTQRGELAVTTDCPQVIQIGAYPPILCHLTVAGFRRNTADPIIVSLPAEADGFGNHANGIQVIGRMQKDVYDLPETFVTDLVITACPSPKNVANNCYDFAATAGAETVVPVRVAQGKDEVTIDLPFTVSGTPDKGDFGGNPTPIATRNADILAAWSQGVAIVAQYPDAMLVSPAAGLPPEWLIETLDVGGLTEFIRICDAETPTACLVIVGGLLQLAEVSRADTASHWTLQIADTGQQVFIVNRAFDGVGITGRDGVLGAEAFDPHWPEARWVLRYRD